MRPFGYERAESAVAAARRAADTGATFIGGGTNLVDLMKLGVMTPERLVDVSRLPNRDIADADDGGLAIGAAATNTALANDPRVRERFRVLSLALLSGATPQIRNKATVGGNLLQRTRCPYFYEVGLPCNKRAPGSGCGARFGRSRDAAVLGTSEHCIAAHPSDMAVAMVALDARLGVRGGDGDLRWLDVDALHRLPGDRPDREHDLAPGDLIETVRLPPPPPGRHVYTKVRDRASYAFALVSVAVVLAVEDGVVTSVRVALGGVAPKPWRARAVEAALTGARATWRAFCAAAEAELAPARGHGDNDFKIPLARRAIAGTLAEAAGIAPEVPTGGRRATP